MCSYVLSEKLKSTSITVNSFHPGLVNTNFGNKQVNWFHNLLWLALKFFGKNPKKVAPEAAYLAFNQDLNKVSGKYFFKGETIPSSPKSSSKVAVKQKSNTLYNVELF